MAERFPIRILADETGVGASTLRAWERRYGLLQPARTPKGHRLYAAEDISRIRRILSLLEDGHSLSAIAQRLRSGDVGATSESAGSSGLGNLWKQAVIESLAAIGDFSASRLQAIHNEYAALYPLSLLTDRLIHPLMDQLHQQQTERRSAAVETQFYRCWLRNQLAGQLSRSWEQTSGRVVICIGLAGESTEIEMMLLSLALMSRGHRVLDLGLGLTVEQVSDVLERSNGRALVISAGSDCGEQEIQYCQSLARLNVPVFMGGPVSDQPLPELESAGIYRLGSILEIAVRVFGSHVSPQDARPRLKLSEA